MRTFFLLSMKTVFFFILCLAVGITVGHLLGLVISPKSKFTEKSNVKPLADDGWTLIGEKGGCRLYTKSISGRLVVWSICAPATSHSSVSTTN
jgi:hypothetical protein